MEITIDQLLSGKATRIKNKEYLPAAAYVEPFLERMSNYTNDFIVQVKLPDQISLTKNNEINLEDTVFNRVYIQAVLPDYIQFENHKQVVGMVYGLDVRKPVYKLFQGGLNCACTNLCVFNPQALNVYDLEPETPMNFKAIGSMMDNLEDVSNWLNKLQNTEVAYNQIGISTRLGDWVRNTMDNSYDTGYGKVKLATSTAIDAYKLLYEKEDSPYYVKPGESTSMFNVYNSFTEIICNSDAKDVVNKCEKVLLLRDILKLA